MEEFDPSDKANIGRGLDEIRQKRMKDFFPSASDFNTAKKVSQWKGDRFEDGTPKLNEEERKTYFEKFRENIKNDKVAEKNGIGVIDKTKERPVGAKTWGWIKFLSFVGVFAISLMAIGVFIAGYVIYSDGTLKDTFVCPNVEIPECPAPAEIPSCPTCPACTLSCGNTTLQPAINCYTNSTI